MKIVIAPDSFKECLCAADVARRVAAGVRKAIPDAEIVCCPMADGGEGTVDAVLGATEAVSVSVVVANPVGAPVAARYCVWRDTAVIEMAEASGLERLSPHERNPLLTHTFGTGELIAHALQAGIRNFVVAVGGSATVDGGTGMARALGYGFTDVSGAPTPLGGGYLSDIAQITPACLSGAVSAAEFRVAVDITGPLLGPKGAAQMYGPQKGATPDMVNRLEAGLGHLQQYLYSVGMLSPLSVPGDGAAGGLGMGVRAFLGGTICRGAEVVADLVGLDDALRGADWVITGEGRTDAQSAEGKVCTYVASLAKSRGGQSLLLSGSISDDASPATGAFTAWRGISAPNVPLAVSMRDAGYNLERAAADFFS
ncbi:MAG: glycerate kinase [Deltaproteobacteria bacterium]|nr:glycerate kinase [Deltaproteobacteria bacterium]MBN2672460.1 glycerate kinase [Deltaproteobacteria bacterium]